MLIVMFIIVVMDGKEKMITKLNVLLLFVSIHVKTEVDVVDQTHVNVRMASLVHSVSWITTNVKTQK